MIINMRRRLLGLIFCLQLFLCVGVYGQSSDDCEIILNQAAEEVSAGHFLGVDSLLADCLKGGFTREQRQRAYLLLTQVYLLLDNPEKAEESYLELLRANPEFVTDPSRDPIDVVYLSKKFTSTPIFSLLGRIGGNVTFVNVLREMSLSGVPLDTRYVLLPGWTAAVGANYNINDNLSIGSELQYAYTTYRKEQSGLWTTDDVIIQDRLGWFNLPVTVIYNFKTGKVVPYAYGGAAINYLFSSKANPTLNDRFTSGSGSVTPSESPIVKYDYKRKNWNWSLVAGGGIRYKWDLHYVFADVRYTLGMKNVMDYSGLVNDYTKEGSQLIASSEPTWRYASSDDFFKLNHLYFTIGYMHQLYNPRKLKTARTQSVLRSILRGKHDN
nr:MAG: hypothetical protein DIU61_04400 [Bacteroidota bacterium]